MTKKVYFSKDHLENIRTVFSDRKLSTGYADVKSYNGYYAYGMLATGTNMNYNPAEVRYGQGNHEKDDEVLNQTGTSINMGARWLDVRLPVTLTPDPAQEMYAFSSPFSVFGCNPIIFSDNSGATLEVAGKVPIALLDVQSLIPAQYRSLITLETGNKIAFDVNKLPENVRQYEGVKLVNDLITSPDNYKYTVGNTVNLIRPETGQAGPVTTIPNSSYKSAIDNLSNTEYYPDKPFAGDAPEAGFKGSVRIAEGEFQVESFLQDFPGSNSGATLTIPRSNVVFHELKENLLRSKGMFYSENSKTEFGGAHEAASKLGKSFSKQLKQPSTGSGGGRELLFIPKKTVE